MVPLLAAAALWAASVAGTVVGPEGKPVVDARIRIEVLGLSARTDSAGKFRLAEVREGRWTAEVQAEGFAAHRVVITVPSRGTLELEFELSRPPRAESGGAPGGEQAVAVTVEVRSEGGQPLEAATVALGPQTAVTDARGRARLADLTAGPAHLRAWRVGYEPADSAFILEANQQPVVLVMRMRPFEFLPLTVRAERPELGGRELERALFDREVQPGVIGISQAELRAIPAAGERDILRALQAVPSVVAVNDLNAQLLVKGGGPDQNLFLLNGIPIIAPYHAFGLFGAVNSDAVSRVEFHRGNLPARFGGVASSVVSMSQREGGARPNIEAGLGIIGARVTASGAAKSADLRWLVAGRQSHLHLWANRFFDGSVPYRFWDINGQIGVTPAKGQRLELTFFGSGDQFRERYGVIDEGSDRLHSTWANRVVGLRWSRASRDAWSANANLWYSGYRNVLRAGDSLVGPTTSNRIHLAGAGIELLRRALNWGIRTGLQAQAGSVTLSDDGKPGGFFDGSLRSTPVELAGYLEVERWLGPIRVNPGVRATSPTPGQRFFIEPRLAARWQLTSALTVSAAASRNSQLLSGLQDERYLLFGAPLLFHRPADAPATESTGGEVAADLWTGAWSFSASAYTRQLRAVPRWRPEGSRRIDQITYDDGSATGFELFARRHHGALTGWIGYGLSAVRLRTSPSDEYAPVWDRRHNFTAATFLALPRRITLSSRASVGSGQPFWLHEGDFEGKRFDPLSDGQVGGGFVPGDRFPVFASAQSRFPLYARIDLALSTEVRLAGGALRLFASVLNVTHHPNVLYYTQKTQQEAGTVLLSPVRQLGVFPMIGIDFVR
ncbi:MAG: TonB-dependent receptor [Gemmatimonadales bacterium]|nr:TonB-dependent receptor [Gemmatimonadales bacterium]